MIRITWTTACLAITGAVLVYLAGFCTAPLVAWSIARRLWLGPRPRRASPKARRMFLVSAVLGAALLISGPSHPATHQRPPAAVSGARRAYSAPPRPDSKHFMYEGPVYGWRPTTMMPAPVHVHPHRPWMWQPASFVYAAPTAATPARAPYTMPDLGRTPGQTTDISPEAVCTKRWGHDERHVTEGMKRDVFEEYGFSGYHDPRCIPDAHKHTCEIDHLISRELGGADAKPNLWPEPYGGQCNAHDKDRLENRLHKEVCAGRLNLLQAQAMIRDDWQAAYHHYFGSTPSCPASP